MLQTNECCRITIILYQEIKSVDEDNMTNEHEYLVA